MGSKAKDEKKKGRVEEYSTPSGGRGGGQRTAKERANASSVESVQVVSPCEGGRKEGRGVLDSHGVLDVGGALGSQRSASVCAAYGAREAGKGSYHWYTWGLLTLSR